MLDHQSVKTLAEQHQTELRRQASECRQIRRHLIPRWHVSWSRTRLSAVTEKGSSLVIIISANRMARPSQLS
jgi:hypothetical protein